MTLSSDWRPSYFDLPPGELKRRAAEAHELLGPRCVVCPRGCKVDRREDVKGLCAIGRHAVVASYFPHFGEEDACAAAAAPGRSSSAAATFAACFAKTTTSRGRCAATSTCRTSRSGRASGPGATSSDRITRTSRARRSARCTGRSATLVLDERGLARQGVILRHLVIPGVLDETEAILRWVADELGTGCYANLMAQYYPSGRVGVNGELPELDRHLRRDEYAEAVALAEELGLRLDARSRADGRALSLTG